MFYTHPLIHGCSLRRSKTVVIVQDTEEGDVFLLLMWKNQRAPGGQLIRQIYTCTIFLYKVELPGYCINLFFNAPMMVLRDLGFTSCQVYSGIIFDPGLFILCGFYGCMFFK